MLQSIIDRLISYKSTAVAIVTGLLTLLVGVAVVRAEALTEGVAATGQLFEVIITGLGVVLTLVNLFKKEPAEVEQVKKLVGV